MAIISAASESEPERPAQPVANLNLSETVQVKLQSRPARPVPRAVTPPPAVTAEAADMLRLQWASDILDYTALFRRSSARPGSCPGPAGLPGEAVTSGSLTATRL